MAGERTSDYDAAAEFLSHPVEDPNKVRMLLAGFVNPADVAFLFRSSGIIRSHYAELLTPDAGIREIRHFEELGTSHGWETETRQVMFDTSYEFILIAQEAIRDGNYDETVADELNKELLRLRIRS